MRHHLKRLIPVMTATESSLLHAELHTWVATQWLMYNHIICYCDIHSSLLGEEFPWFIMLYCVYWFTCYYAVFMMLFGMAFAVFCCLINYFWKGTITIQYNFLNDPTKGNIVKSFKIAFIIRKAFIIIGLASSWKCMCSLVDRQNSRDSECLVTKANKLHANKIETLLNKILSHLFSGVTTSQQ